MKYNLAGYTLIELLVVLLIFSLLAGIIFPRLTTMYDSVQVAFERDEVFAHLGELGYLAFRQSRDFTLVNYPTNNEIDNEDKMETSSLTEDEIPSLLKLPEGWKVQVETPILFSSNGVCNGGTIKLQYQQQQFRVKLPPPFCQPEIVTGS
ncbi:MAG: prepilin-type N-terminal cleavage/methylation domain-containing protein [Candidatus Marithrix sp.]